MIFITLSNTDAEFAQKIEGLAEMSAITESPKSFSSEELQLIQIGATFAAAVIPTLTSIFVELWRQHHSYSITIGKDSFSCSGFSKKEALQLAKEYAPHTIRQEDTELVLIEKAVGGFLNQDALVEKACQDDSK